MVPFCCLKFNARLPWLSEQKNRTADCRKIAYRSDFVNRNDRRYDAIEYVHEGELRKGIIHLLLENKLNKNLKVAVVRRLQKVASDDNNKRVAEGFGHEILGYNFNCNSDSDVTLDCVSRIDLRRVLVIVRDMHAVSIRYGILKRMIDIEDTKYERRNARLFLVNRVKTTSIPFITEQKLIFYRLYKFIQQITTTSLFETEQG